MKTIVCYGDSNTWGNVPRSDERHQNPWPSALQEILGKEYKVVSEGLCGRTFVVEDPDKPHRCGIKHLHSILETSDPVDLIIVMLGTNDVKSTYELSAVEIAAHLEQTVELIKSEKVALEKAPKILIVCPPPIIIPVTNDLDERMVRGIDIFMELPKLYKEVADNNGCYFLNAGEYISSSAIDGYHMDADAHLKLAEVITEQIKSLSGKLKLLAI